jgi:DNA-directed RNA polymerase subunit M/transcription elongation factor TFIIS
MNNTICPKCGIVLLPKEENDLVFLQCTVCGFKKEYTEWVEHICQNCNHLKAIVVYHAMVMGDEGTTTIYKCISCGTTDKEGFKG